MRDQPRVHRLSDQIWLKLVRERGKKYGLGSYAKRIFLTRTGRYYVPVEEERIAIRDLQYSKAGKRLLRHHPHYPTAVMPYQKHSTAPAIGSAALIRRPTPFRARRTHLIGPHGYRHRPAPAARSHGITFSYRATGKTDPQPWQPTVRTAPVNR